MSSRLASLVLLSALLVAPLSAKDKNKSALPEYVLRARTVLVVIAPDAGEPLDQPMANSTARENVEKALMQWGRLQPVLDGQEADLVIAVRTGNGKMVNPTIKGGPIDNRPGVVQPIDGGIRIGGQQGRPPYGNDPGMGPQDRGPHVSNEVGPSEDSFEVHRGGRRCSGFAGGVALCREGLFASAQCFGRGGVPQGGGESRATAAGQEALRIWLRDSRSG